jgi:hypothetical protein
LSSQINILNIVKAKPWLVLSLLLILNFALRLLIYFKSNLFYFSDYKVYLNAIETIANGEKQYLLVGNLLFSISFLGYFFKYALGNLDLFFVFNCLLGTLSSLVIYSLVVKVTGLTLAGIITVIIHSVYTEFMVFSSVFYTPVIMIFLLSLFLLLMFFYMESKSKTIVIVSLISSLIVFSLTFFFKPELKYLPWFLLIPGVFLIKKSISVSKKILLLAFLLSPFSFLLEHSGIITRPETNVISNAFVMFGHTDYGGNGGEGAFIYPENKKRYDEALREYAKVHNLTAINRSDYNAFHKQEIKNFIINHPVKWVRLQFTKFFRTFGVVPETTSFKILYTGLFKENLWLTSIIVVAPVSIIILLFVLFFDRKTLSLQDCKTDYFLYVYFTIFIYYIISTIFYGQYQERYRMPLIVCFIIPVLGYFIASLRKDQFLKKSSIVFKGIIIGLLVILWSFQAKKAIVNEQRLENALKTLEVQIVN